MSVMKKYEVYFQRKLLFLVFSTISLTVFYSSIFAQPIGNLHDDFTTILQTHLTVTATATKVDYKTLKQKREPLDAYLGKLGQISRQQFDSWTTSARLAFLINLYNAATLQLIIDHYPVQSIKDIGGFFRGPWDLPVVRLFGEKITLNHLEHKIIRRDFAEPRIHMALVCAAKGCPALRVEAYTAEKLERQLDEQSRNYLTSAAGMRLERATGRLYLSSIFKWYGKDFPSVRAFVEKYSGQNVAGQNIRWIDYDWSLNGL